MENAKALDTENATAHTQASAVQEQAADLQSLIKSLGPQEPSPTLEEQTQPSTNQETQEDQSHLNPQLQTPEAKQATTFFKIAA